MLRWSGVGMVALALGLLSGARPAGAQTLGPVVYDGGASPLSAPGGNYSDFSDGQQVGEIFTLNETTQFSGVRWWGCYAGTPRTDNFTVRVFSVSSGIPAVTPLYNFAVGSAVNPTAHGTVSGSLAQFQYEAVLPTTSLGAGSYLMSVVNNTGPDPNWFWSVHNTSGTEYRRFGDAQTWTSSNSASYAFQLTGAAETPAVPEPSSVLLFLPALGAMVITKRRRSA